MTADPTPLQERLWDAIFAARDLPGKTGEASTVSIVEAILPIIAVEVRKGQAEALRDAADAWHAEHEGTRPGPYRWMWDRATEYETGDRA